MFNKFCNQLVIECISKLLTIQPSACAYQDLRSYLVVKPLPSSSPPTFVLFEFSLAGPGEFQWILGAQWAASTSLGIGINHVRGSGVEVAIKRRLLKCEGKEQQFKPSTWRHSKNILQQKLAERSTREINLRQTGGWSPQAGFSRNPFVWWFLKHRGVMSLVKE